MVKKLTPANVAEWLEQEAAYNTTTGERLSKPIRALIAENEAKDAEIERLREALTPFAKAGELFVNYPGELEATIYAPAVGEEYHLKSTHLLTARQALTRKDGE